MMKALALSVVLLAASSQSASLLYAQGCQDQGCYWNYSSLCYQCLKTTGFACAPTKGAKCPKVCTESVCDEGGDSATQAKRSGGCCINPAKLAQLQTPKLVLASLQTNSTDNGKDEDIQFSLDPGSANDPAMLLGTTHDADKDLFANGLAKNLSSSSLTAYRIGWLLIPKGEGLSSKVKTGPLVNIPDEVKSGTEFNVTAQSVDPLLLQTGLKTIVFFIAEVRLLDGTDWKADISQIREKYQPAPDAPDSSVRHV